VRCGQDLVGQCLAERSARVPVEKPGEPGPPRMTNGVRIGASGGQEPQRGLVAQVGRERRPHHSPQQMPAALEDEIVRLRKKLQGQGLDAGAETIRAMLVAGTSMSAPANCPIPAVSTIWRILTRRGFVIPQPHKRPRSSWQRFAATQPNERWQADVTHWQLADGTDVEILNIIDDHSRLAVGSAARRTTLAPDVVATFA
jgi:transposase InsO family protein